MLNYFLADCLQAVGDPDAAQAWQQAAAADSRYCFPSSTAEHLVLQRAIHHNPSDSKAHYYIGCLLYDKKRHNDAQLAWQASVALDDTFPTVRRNLALYYANKCGDYQLARQELERAFALDETDARVFYELCELYGKLALPLDERCRIMEQHRTLVDSRDDLNEPQVIDYFAVSLPDFLVFDTDLDETNRLHCYYMMGLGYGGLGELDKARQAFDAALAVAPCHYGVRCHRQLILG